LQAAQKNSCTAGALLREAGRPAEAEQAYREALAQRERLLGADHPQYALTLSNLGVLLGESGRIAEGRDCLARALPVLLARYGASHPHSIACQEACERAADQAAGAGEGGETQVCAADHDPPAHVASLVSR
jgi:tetratricopeptide (TPR) repeat protein